MTVYFFGFVSLFLFFFIHPPFIPLHPASTVGFLPPAVQTIADYSYIRISSFDSVILANSIGFVI